MSTVEILEQPTTVVVEAPQTVEIIESPTSVVVSVDGNVTITEQPTTVVVTGGDTITIQDSSTVVEIGAADHPAHHEIGGPNHTGVISAAQHGTPAGDLHTVYPQAAAAETITEPWTFSKLMKATPPKDSGTATSATTTTVTDTGKAWTVNQWAGGRISISGQQRHIASNTATVITVTVAFSPAPSGAYAIVPAPSYDVQVPGEAHAQARFGADGVGFGPGTAAQIMGLRRARGDVAGIAANAGIEFWRSTLVAPVFYGVAGSATPDTQPRWVFGAGGNEVQAGPGGAVAPDTKLGRSAAGVWSVTNALKLLGTNGAGFLELPSQLPNPPAFGATAVRFYARTFIGTTRPFYVDDLGRINGPLGMLHGVLGVSSGPAGGLQVFDSEGAAGLTGVDAFGTLSTPTPSGTLATMFSGGWGHPYLEMDTGSVINTDAGLEWPKHLKLSADPQYALELQLSAITDVRCFIGWTDQTLATMLGSDDPAGNYVGVKYSTTSPAPDSGTADAAVTTTINTLTDTREAWTIDQWVGATVTCNGKTIVVASNTATTLTGVGEWPGSAPGDGFAWAMTWPNWQFVVKDGTTQLVTSTTFAAIADLTRILHIYTDHDAGVYARIFGGSWDAGTALTLLPNADIPAHTVTLRPVLGIRNLAAASKKLRVSFAWESVL